MAEPGLRKADNITGTHSVAHFEAAIANLCRADNALKERLRRQEEAIRLAAEAEAVWQCLPQRLSRRDKMIGVLAAIV